MTTKQEAGHNLRFKYEWFYPTADETNPGKIKIDWREEDCGQLKEWTLIQVEGEEPAAVEPTPEANAPPAKGKAKAQPKKQVEEVIDNRPRTIKYERSWLQDEGAGTRFTEEIAT